MEQYDTCQQSQTVSFINILFLIFKMPGSLTHAYIFNKHHKNLLGSIIPDYLPFFTDFEWQEAHDLKKAKAFKKYLKKVDKSSLWLAKGMISHIILDKAAFKNRKLAKQRSILNKKIKKIVSLSEENLEETSDLVLDMVMDNHIKRKNKFLPEILETSIKKTNVGLIAKHIADFYNKDADEIEKGIKHLETLDFNQVTSSVQVASKEYFKFCAMKKSALMTRMYGMYLNRILKKNKKEIDHIFDHSHEFLSRIENQKTNLHEIMEFLQDDHHKEFKQKVYI